MQFAYCYRAYFPFWNRHGFKMLIACLKNMHGNGEYMTRFSRTLNRSTNKKKTEGKDFFIFTEWKRI